MFHLILVFASFLFDGKVQLKVCLDLDQEFRLCFNVVLIGPSTLVAVLDAISRSELVFTPYINVSIRVRIHVLLKAHQCQLDIVCMSFSISVLIYD